MTSLLEEATECGARGMRIFPVQPGGKSPMTANGFHDATCDLDQIEQWWTDHPEANIGWALDGLVVVDIDPGGEFWLADEPEKRAELLAGATQRTPRGGTHHIFKKPSNREWSRKVKQIHEHVDILTDGGYIILPPSQVHGIGKYEWVPGCELENVDSLAEPPAWLIEAVDRLHRKDAPKIAVSHSSGNAIQDGRRNDTLTRHAGGMRRMGMTEQEIRAALRAINESRCIPPLPVGEVDKVAWSIGQKEPDQCTVSYIESLCTQYTLAEIETEEEPDSPGDFPEKLLQCGGTMQEFCEFANSTSRRQQPVLSLGAAMALMSVITGRKVKDASGTRGNLYCINVAKSGQGKNNGVSAISTVLNLAGGEHLIYQSGFHSESSVWSMLQKEYCFLSVIDEFGHYLTSANSNKAGSHLRAVPKTFMQLFSAAGTVAAPPASADRDRNRKIDQPHLAILGASTPETFFASITQEMVESGFLPRLLFFVAPEGHPDLRADVPDMEPPEHLCLQVQKWVAFQPGGNLSDKFKAQPMTVPITQEADEFLYNLYQTVNSLEKHSKPVYQPIWARAMEMFRKVALVHSCSLAPEPKDTKIDLVSVEWAWSLIEYLYRNLEQLIAEHMASSEFESYQLRFTRWLKKQPCQRASHRTAMMNVLRRFPKRLREDIVQTLIESGKVWRMEEQTGGRPRVYYSMNKADLEPV